ncbi:MAG: hypothetical protein INR66_22840, partial [Gordonia polyisoprenivorans]|nr:hypothetical protein [Gordonia polyisoprenivorans]
MTTVDLSAPRDARALIGMHTPAARVVVAVYLACVAFAMLATVPHTPQAIIAMVLGLLIIGSATVALLLVPGDPLPRPITAALACAPAVACAVILSGGPDLPPPTTGWAHGIGTMVLFFMCVRGRTGTAWVGMALMVSVYVVRSAILGLPPLQHIDNVLIDLGPLVMAT